MVKLSYPNENTLMVNLSKDWNIHNGIPSVNEVLDTLESNTALNKITFSVKDLGKWDSTILTYIKQLIDYADRKRIQIDLEGLPKGIQKLITIAYAVPESENRTDDIPDESILARIGSSSVEFKNIAFDLVGFFGDVILSLIKLVAGKARFRKIDLFEQMMLTGVQALPIVTLITVLIGVILAFIGAVQLKQFGASLYVADLVGVAMTREMGPMMTAIIVAGRSGAAFAAQLGTMTLNEEIDAFKTSGFNPMEFLVLPRLLALSSMVPLLTMYAIFMGILGGSIVGVLFLDLSFFQYLGQTGKAVSPMYFLLGLIKSVVYGSLVAVAGCMRGIQCGRSASAVGNAATSAVVIGIVLIILASAVTTLIYSIFGL